MDVSHTSSPVEQTVMATVRVVHAQQATFLSQKKEEKKEKSQVKNLRPV
jgi:hypothetical protein